MEHGLTLLSDGSAAAAVTPVCLPTWDSETAPAEATKDTALLYQDSSRPNHPFAATPEMRSACYLMFQRKTS